MKLTITAAQRDALYDQILDRLSGIGDIELAIKAENYGDAERLAREYSDDLQLLFNDLGVGKATGNSVTLLTSPDVLRRALPRLRELANRLTASMEPERIEDDELRERNRLISQACKRLLDSLDSESRGGSKGA